MTPDAARRRIRHTGILLLCLFAGPLGRLVWLVTIDREFLGEQARKQHVREWVLPPDRGLIVDRAGSVLALTTESASVSIDPKNAVVGTLAASRLAELLNLPADEILRKSGSDRPYSFLKRNVSVETADAVAALRVPGVIVAPSRKRDYPRGTTAGQVVGLANIDGVGIEGLEAFYDGYLAGSAERVVVERDAKGRYRLASERNESQSRRGARLELTLDANLQRVLEDEMQAAVAQFRAVGAYGVILDPDSGEVLALANVPTFDPNRRRDFPVEARKNGAIAFRYEPGSTFKTILAAAGIETGLTWPEQRLDCERGRYKVGRHTIHDHDPYGVLSFLEVIKYSSNIGSAKVGQKIGASEFYRFISEFGFGAPTGIDLPNEATGTLRPLSQWKQIDVVTASYGHGISVTPLQLARAYAAVANGGRLLRPYIVRRVVGPDENVLLENHPQVTGTPIAPRTSEVVTSLLREVVAGGTGTKAALKNIAVAGKTGTTKKIEANGSYSSRDYIASFAGYFPADDPQFVIVILVDTPHGAIYGGAVAGPLFQRVGEYIADHYELRAPAIPPMPVSPPAETMQLVTWPADTEPGGMPSYLGLSLREALSQARRAGWEVVASGSGFVVSQDPPPGVTTGTDRVLRLELRSTVG